MLKMKSQILKAGTHGHWRAPHRIPPTQAPHRGSHRLGLCSPAPQGVPRTPPGGIALPGEAPHPLMPPKYLGAAMFLVPVPVPPHQRVLVPGQQHCPDRKGPGIPLLQARPSSTFLNPAQLPSLAGAITLISRAYPLVSRPGSPAPGPGGHWEALAPGWLWSRRPSYKEPLAKGTHGQGPISCCIINRL